MDPLEMHSALVIVDLQNDFLPEGSLPIKGGNEIIPVVNQLLHLPFHTKVASLDWHPSDHSSFAINHNSVVGEVIIWQGIPQELWPVHCVQNTYGAQLAGQLDKGCLQRLFYKGIDTSIDSYSCFFDNDHRHSTGMAEYLQEMEIGRLYFVGLATDYCVKSSVLDALSLNFEVYIISDACRGVDIQANGCQETLEYLQHAGAKVITSAQLLLQSTFM
jgi:nicotinamidase/pyrazinamidase